MLDSIQQQIRIKLLELADEEYRKFHVNICPNAGKFIGIRTPILRNVAKEIVKGDFRKYLKTAQDDYYEETMLQGMVISLAKMEINEKLEYVTKFVPKIYNWAICDTFCTGIKLKKGEYKIVWDYLQQYLKSDNEYEVRFAVVMMISNYINDEYINKVIIELDKIKSEQYYVEMAVAWAISFCFIKYPVVTMNYLKNNNLNDFTYNKAIQKTIESYRVDKNTKEILKKMKKHNKFS